jgi:hypothetical protein
LGIAIGTGMTTTEFFHRSFKANGTNVTDLHADVASDFGPKVQIAFDRG